MIPDPYRIAAPAMISFSGGRTSAFMLYKILEAYGGELPIGIEPIFANTGKERPETLRFVLECQLRWNVTIHWVERRPTRIGFEEVTFQTAAREGEPFTQLIRQRQYCPNAVARFCTEELKINPMIKWMRSHGYRLWNNAVGLRYDEGHRILKALDRNELPKKQFHTIMPLAKARVTQREVAEFWAQQCFDLQLKPGEGNCDLCFMKSRLTLLTLIRDHPELATWWIEREREIGARFVTEYDYRELLEECRKQGDLFAGWLGDEHDVECGLLCSP